VLIVIVAVFLAYNANQGLPFLPTVDVQVQSRNAAALGRGSEVREGGFRVGFVESVRPVKLPNGRGGAEFRLKLDSVVGDLPVDTVFTIRPRSPLGLKYLEMARGGSERTAPQGHTFPAPQTVIPVQVDDVNRMFDAKTRLGVQRNLQGFGTALAGRGQSLNQAIEDLPILFFLLEPVAANLASPETNIGRFFRELGDAARIVAPLAAIQADFFTQAADTFEAISRDPEALKETISRSHPAFQAGIDSFPVQRPFLTDSAALAREMRPFTRELRPTLPLINAALRTGIPVLGRSVDFYERLRPALVALRDLALDPATLVALRALTANVTTLNPQLRFLGPYQTVCNYWTYFWTFLGEHVSQEAPVGFIQRALVRSTGQQSNNPSSMGAPFPANGEDYEEISRPRGDPAHLHGQAYQNAITPGGRADCENGQRGYMRRLARFSPNEYRIVTNSATPGVQGTTFTGRARVLRGQTFTPVAETGAKRP
jgi:ABC-type transporter Mla subunit MlaD